MQTAFPILRQTNPFARVNVRGVLLLVAFCAGGWGTTAAQGDAAVRLYRAQQLIMENVGYYLDGAVEVDVEKGTVEWKASPREIERTLVDVIQYAAALQRVEGLVEDVELSDETRALIERVAQLTFRDLRHWRMAEGLTEAEQWYVMVQTALDELRMQVGIDMKMFLNRSLLEALQAARESGSETGVNEGNWLEVETGVSLPELAWDVSDATDDALSLEDGSAWSGNALAGTDAILERILQLLEAQDARLRRLESGSTGGTLEPPASTWGDGTLRLPEYMDVTFYSGSKRLTLGAQLQLNEIIEVLGRYPSIRVVCTGYADTQGDRQFNLTLSRQRAEVVRGYLLQSGIAPERALLNFFGEERATAAGPSERRVEVRFYSN